MKKEGIPFDGFGSVVEMLRKSDATFREKILRNIRRLDPQLARRLEAHLSPTNTKSNNESSHRSVHTRNYGSL
ncbi:MAG: hypothetical protein M9962_00070 [Oligoflexia bacterium]|nr:hypothetical protein [Oligoflexia bacterium]